MVRTFLAIKVTSFMFFKTDCVSEQQVAQAQTEISQIKASYEEQIAALHQKNQALQTV